MTALLSSSLESCKRGWASAVTCAKRHPVALGVGLSALSALAYYAVPAVQGCFNPPPHCYMTDVIQTVREQPKLFGSEYLGSFVFNTIEVKTVYPKSWQVCQWGPNEMTVCTKGLDMVREHGKRAAAVLGGTLLAAAGIRRLLSNK